MALFYSKSNNMEIEELTELEKSLRLSFTADGQQIDKAHQVLDKMIACTKLTLHRHEITESFWKILLNVVEITGVVVKNECFSPQELDLLVDLLRFLRNACAGCCQDDQLITSSEEILEIPSQILIRLVARKSNTTEKEIMALRCCLQFFGNVVCQSVTSKAIVWKLFTERDFFRILLGGSDLKIRGCVMMILYHCMKPADVSHLLHTPEGPNIVLALTDSLCHNDIIDWGILILECVVCEQAFMANCYNGLPTQNRLLLLDVILELVESMNTDTPKISETTLQSIKDLFVENVGNIKVPDSPGSDALKTLETTRLLTVLCAASIDIRWSNVVKSYRDLLEVSITTLKMVHLLGKQSSNALTPISKKEDFYKVSEEEIRNKGSYCFKKNLIRLIGNMCADCQQNQNMVREFEGIPLLLDCSCIDKRNPYITEWVNLAIKNLLENNQKNRKAVARLVSSDNFKVTKNM